MSVIVTGMTMPNNCNRCGIVEEKAKTTCKSNGCPLKSIDGLIKKIVNSPSDVGQDMYKTKYDGAVRRQNEIIEIIKEYCEVSE